MIFKYSQVIALTLLVGLGGCVVDPGYYGPEAVAPPPVYGYYGYGGAYPWNTGVNIDIGNGYGRGYYGGYHGYRGGYGRGGGGFHGGGSFHGGGGHGGGSGHGYH